MAVKRDKTQKAEEQNQKHDKGYKGILSDCAVFLHFLKKYFASAKWTEMISADDLTRVDKSFINKKYSKIDSDIVYKLRINGTDVYFYVLIELQTKVDFTMPFRLLCYMTELMADVFNNTDEKVRKRKGFRMPAIVPIVLYTGKDKWTAAMSYREYTENCGGIFGDCAIDFRYLLCDMNRLDDGVVEPSEDALDAVFAVEKKRLKRPKKTLTLEDIQSWWVNNVSGLSENNRDKLINWLDFMYFNGKMPPHIKEWLLNFKLNEVEETDMKSLADVWYEDAVLKGRREGVLEGVREGMREGEKRKALKVATHLKSLGRMTVDEIAEATGLTVDDILRM